MSSEDPSNPYAPPADLRQAAAPSVPHDDLGATYKSLANAATSLAVVLLLAMVMAMGSFLLVANGGGEAVWMAVAGVAAFVSLSLWWAVLGVRRAARLAAEVPDDERALGVAQSSAWLFRCLALAPVLAFAALVVVGFLLALRGGRS